jgi:hypothetical protein
MVKSFGLTMIFAFILSELHGFIRDFWPGIDNVKVDLFWSPWYKLQIHAQTYIKTILDDLQKAVIFYAFARVVIDRSIKLYFICCIYIYYELGEMICFMWDYKDNRLIYWLLTGCSTIATLILIFPHKQSMKSVK